jgi:hypothetical protein
MHIITTVTQFCVIVVIHIYKVVIFRAIQQWNFTTKFTVHIWIIHIHLQLLHSCRATYVYSWWTVCWEPKWMVVNNLNLQELRFSWWWRNMLPKYLEKNTVHGSNMLLQNVCEFLPDYSMLRQILEDDNLQLELGHTFKPPCFLILVVTEAHCNIHQ